MVANNILYLIAPCRSDHIGKLLCLKALKKDINESHFDNTPYVNLSSCALKQEAICAFRRSHSFDTRKKEF